MTYPTLRSLPIEKRTISEFRGYDHGMCTGEGAWFDMRNLCSDGFPVMRTRPHRGVWLRSGDRITGMIAKEGLCWTAGPCFYHEGEPVDMGLNDEPKQLVSMGASVVILPDRKWINTLDHSFGSLDSSFTAPRVRLLLCTQEGEPQPPDSVGTDEPEAPQNGMLWLDTGSRTLKKYSTASSQWAAVPTTYVRLEAPGIGADFSQYDGIRIDGLEGEADVCALNGSAVVWERGEDYLVVTGLLEAVRESAVTVTRRMPEVDFLIESGNRLWGCRYGLNDRGEAVNEIYASKLGDFRNWGCFMGISTDSYAVSIGSDGPFTGAVTLGGYPLFFKENTLHKIYGQMPSNFQVQSTACRGVQRGSAASMAIVNEVLYYLGTAGVCAYDGSLPVEVSSQFGAVRYHAGIAAGCGNKYYLRTLDESGAACVFVLDTARGLWHKESDCGDVLLCACRGDVFAAREYEILSLLGSGEDAEEDFSWMAETGILGAASMAGKRLARASLRLAMAEGSTMRLLVQYDSAGPWLEIGRVRSKQLRAFVMPVRTQRCDHLRLRMEGNGECIVYAIALEVEACGPGGSDGLVVSV